MPDVEEEGGGAIRNDASPSPIVTQGEKEEEEGQVSEEREENSSLSDDKEGVGEEGGGGDTDPSPSHVNGVGVTFVSSSSSTSSDSSDLQDNSGAEYKLNKVAKLLGPKIMVGLKLSCLLLTVFLVFAQSRSPLVKSSTPFFPRHSLITDFYSGDVAALTDRLLAADLSFVVYYAPWDRESQILRWEIEKVARYYHEQIYFAAINCWHPRSECKSKYKIRLFPALILHVRSASGLETKAMAYGGPKDAGHIIRFLSRTLRPLAHITSNADLARLQIEHNAVVLGFYDFTSMKKLPKGFNSFYLASLRALQYDNTNSVAWGVVTNARAAKALSFNVSQSVHIVLWNTTLVYTAARTADSEAISNWAFKRLDETAMWVELPGSKSLALHKVLQEGPALIVFTPDNPYYSANDPFTLLREVSLDYNNCEESNRVSNLVQYIGSVRSRGRGQLRQAERICRSYLKEQLSVRHQFNLQDENCCSNVPSLDGDKQGVGGTSQGCDHCIYESGRVGPLQEGHCATSSSMIEESDLLQQVNSLMSVFSDSCRELMLQYTPWQHQNICCQRNTTSKTEASSSVSDNEDKPAEHNHLEGGQKDDRIEKLVAISSEEQCKRLFHGSLLATPALLKDQEPSPSITGLGCKTNRTLAFVAIDSLHHKDVAERLGINMTAREPPNTAAVIVDMEKEVHFVLDASLSKPTLVNFILNYTSSLLDRKLVSSHEEAPCEPGHMCIKELTAENYLTVTQEPGQMVVILHYSRTCAACTTVGHVFLSVANAAHHLPNVTFARIDTLTNILPWHLYFEKLPTIIVHPHFRKSESRIFDSTRPLTPANLLSFIIANLDAGYRLMLALSTCGEECQEGVSQAARINAMQIHHSLTTSTAKLQHIMDQISKLIVSEGPNLEDSPSKSSHYHLLVFAKAHLISQIKKNRIKLIHLGQLNKLLNVALEKNLSVFGDLLKSLYYITHRKKVVIKGNGEKIISHDEL